MRKFKYLLLFLATWCINTNAASNHNPEQQDSTQNTRYEEITKKGWNIGPFPSVGFDADKGFLFGAIVNLYDFGDGTNYPDPRQRIQIDGGYYTKGSQYYRAIYDTKHLIPHTRMNVAAYFNHDKAMEFYGFNGYQSYYDTERMNAGYEGKDYLYTPFYRIGRNDLIVKADFEGSIWENKLFWQAGYHFQWVDIWDINLERINKGKEPNEVYPADSLTLYQHYKDWGIISQSEAKGGISSALRLGLKYDTRNKESAPTRGIWAEAHTIIAPSWLGTTHPYYRYGLSFRHYVPIVKNDILTFAYRLGYQGTIGKDAPFYMFPFYTVVGNGLDNVGFGGYRTVRGILSSKLQALDVGFWNIELRYRFVEFNLWKQNWALGLNAFTDGAIVTRNYDMSYQGNPNDAEQKKAYDAYMNASTPYVSKAGNDLPHVTYGLGGRIIMNENFIVAVEYGFSANKQDGGGGIYFNTGYLF